MQLRIPRLSLAAIIPMMSQAALFDAMIRLIGVGLVIFAVLLTSRWLTDLTAPRLVAKLPSAPAAPPENNLKLVIRLFGASEAPAQALDGIQLVGVFAGSRGGGFATFSTRSGAISVFTGGEVAPGVKLKQIERDRVILLSAGIQKELRMSESGGQPVIQVTPAPAIIPQSDSSNNAQEGESNYQAKRKQRGQHMQEVE
jgi:hypothetical protein